ncbi:MAG: RidA family protein [Candidatus Symbiobacter sp.]|nr:RidA family protein [Candidatus Symbiobacter sp.]
MSNTPKPHASTGQVTGQGTSQVTGQGTGQGTDQGTGQVIGQGGVSLPFSPALQAGDFIFVSGQVGFDADKKIVLGGIEAETAQCLANIAAILAEFGANLDDIVKCNVWLDDARDFAAFNRVYAAAFGPRKPARSTVESRLMIDAKVEIDAIAYFPSAAAKTQKGA